MSFISRFIKAWRDASVLYKYDIVAEEGWTEADDKALQVFSEGKTGVKLATRLRNHILMSALVAMQQPSQKEYHYGIVQGMQKAILFKDQILIAGHLRNSVDTEDQQVESLPADFDS